VVVRAARADLDVDRDSPVGYLPQLLDLDLEVVWPRPVGMPEGAALVDADRQVAHLGNAIGDLVPGQHPAPAGLGALSDDHLDRDRNVQLDRLARIASADHDVRIAPFAIALERVAGDARTEEQEIVEMRHVPFGAEALDRVHALARRTLDLGDRIAVERGRLA